MANKWVYLFTEGDASMRELLGGKGANLAEMTKLGLPVPQGFTISTEACTQYYEDGRQINDEIMGQIMEHIEKMEEITGKKFGDKENPLLVSVRSGARASMPGMMDTILNLGLNEDVVEVIAKKSGNPRWAWDCYRRFIQMFSDVVMEVGKKYFEELIDKMKAEKGGGKHLKSEPISQGLWKQKKNTRNRSRISPNRAAEKGEATARFRVFLCRFKESIPKQKKQTRHHRCRHHGDNFYCLQIQIINERGISMNVKNEIKSIIVRSGMTMQQVVDLLSDEYGWSDSISNFSNKLSRGSLRYREAIQLADVMGYDLVWQKRRDG